MTCQYSTWISEGTSQYLAMTHLILRNDGKRLILRPIKVKLCPAMHEVAIMTEAIRMAEEAARSAGAARILKLRLRLGSLSGVVEDSLYFAFDVVSHDTLVAGAVLEIERVSAACWCAGCNLEFECADFLNECPRCHSPSGELRRGRELEIAAVELE